MNNKISNNLLTDKEKERERQRIIRSFSNRGLRFRRVRRIIDIIFWGITVSIISGAKRFVDIFLSLCLILILIPLLVILGFISQLTTGQVFLREEKAGRFMVPFYLLSFSCSNKSIIYKIKLNKLPHLFNILKGDISFIGPRIVELNEINNRERAVRKRMNTRPGILCLWWIRQRGNVNYETEWDVDSEYIDQQSLKSDFGIALRSIPAMLLGGTVETAPDILWIFGLRINNVTMTESLDILINHMTVGNHFRVCFVNADCGNVSFKNQEYRQCLLNADFVLADGIGFKIAGKLLKQEIRQNVNGTDMFPRLLAEMGKTNKSIYLLGGKPGVSDDVVLYIKENFPGVKIAGFQHGYFNNDEEENIINEINKSKPDCLLVAFGAPKQDLWIEKNIMSTDAKVAIGVGGLFDFFAGRVPRAPQWLRDIGLEWLFRLIQEPGRMWKRYLVGNSLFLWRTIRERLTSPKSD